MLLVLDNVVIRGKVRRNRKPEGIPRQGKVPLLKMVPQRRWRRLLLVVVLVLSDRGGPGEGDGLAAGVVGGGEEVGGAGVVARLAPHPIGQAAVQW